ncbi:hypothetical protein SAMN05216277_1236 [Halolamina pelagica]|uniref:Uncharacterized protein n=1 Tax=Halolamina pelagica TaxID=699431 RepID=A0A1I5W4L4_9EURY|nr:hypothetical protein SAMN05216277_1236 [Halolamina pelagica]
MDLTRCLDYLFTTDCDEVISETTCITSYRGITVL